MEILDLAINEIEEISGMEAMADTLDELWINNNKISDYSSIEYLGKTMKKLNGIYLAVNPVYNRSEEFKKKLKETIPCINEVEGMPLDRPQYFI